MLRYVNPDLRLTPETMPEPGQFVWRSPSNLAIIKYWGKHGNQLPRNPSLSFTLAASVTDLVLEYAPREDDPADDAPVSLNFLFHEEPQEEFRARMLEHLTRLLPVFPFLNQLELSIRTGNSFPHSAGIASSASAMSAIALALCSLEDELFNTLGEPDEFDRKASYIARLGSGSACRSIFPYAALWGETPLVPGSSDEYAIPAEEWLHPVFKTYQNDILIVSSNEKAVSSSAGHALMENHPFASARFEQARARMERLLGALKSGDMNTFGEIAEDEALTLHSLMMSSRPSYLLLHPNTIQMIERIRDYRESTKHPVYFSLDAGPNIHLLYPEEIVHEVRLFIEEELSELCEEGYIQHDWVGDGPEEF